MADTAYTFALSTVARVKARLGITDTGFDTVFISYLNGVTDFIERYCGRRFKETTYANEEYDIPEGGVRTLVLRNGPVTSLTSFQYRAGLPSNPSWTDFPADSYQLAARTEEGIIHSDQDLPSGIRTVRVSYVAGYKIAFASYGTPGTHDLPADLTEIAERLITKAHKKRDAEGKTSEGFNGSNIQWDKFLDDDAKAMLEPFRRNIQFV